MKNLILFVSICFFFGAMTSCQKEDVSPQCDNVTFVNNSETQQSVIITHSGKPQENLSIPPGYSYQKDYCELSLKTTIFIRDVNDYNKPVTLTPGMGTLEYDITDDDPSY